MTQMVLITGASARIGRILAEGLAQDGHTVIIHYHRSAEKAQALAKAITDAGGRAATVGADLCEPEALNSLISRASDAVQSPLTALINNASTFENDSAADLTRTMFDSHMDVNLYAPLALSRDFAAQCPADVQGNIINIIDQRVLKPNPLFFSYSLSKTALFQATKTLAQAFAPHIRVNGIGPGPTLANHMQAPGEFEAEAEATLLGYASAPAAHLQAVRYLLDARSVTGQMMAVDSGQHLTWQTPDLMIGEHNGA